MLSAPLHMAWPSAVDGKMLGKRMPALPVVFMRAGGVHGVVVATSGVALGTGTGTGAGTDTGTGADANANAGTGAREGAGVMLVDFSAPQCVPCSRNVTLLNRLQRDYRARGLTVVGMARAPPLHTASVVWDSPRDYALGSDPDGALSAQLGTNSMRPAVLVDRNGIIVWQGDPANLGRATIERTLSAPALGELLRL
ncbi:MAG: TlpA family protein disulfide reductase [Pseudomonadota bacterium]|nr:TlpA family protein disulfide reductase [Pseudomonadota bacterium]